MQGFLDLGTDIRPIVPALEKIWADSLGRSLSDFNFCSVTSKFNELVFQYPIRIPERYALVIRCRAIQYRSAIMLVLPYLISLAWGYKCQTWCFACFTWPGHAKCEGAWSGLCAGRWAGEGGQHGAGS